MEHESLSGPLPSHHSRGPLALAVQTTLFSLATVLFALRFYVRKFVRNGLGWDDFFLFLAWAVALWETITISNAIDAGFGQHILYIPHQNIERLLYWSVLGQIMSPFGVGLVKISVILFVLRLVKKSTNTRWIRWTCYIDMAVFIPFTVAVSLLLCFQCVPLKLVWTHIGPPDPRCLSGRTLSYVGGALSVVNAITDLLTAGLSVAVLSHLNINKRTKISLCVLTGLGGLLAATSITRAILFFGVTVTYDVTYELAPYAIWSLVEHEVGIMIACIPVCAPWVSHMFKLLTNGHTSLSPSSPSNLNDKQQRASRTLFGSPSLFQDSFNDTRTSQTKMTGAVYEVDEYDTKRSSAITTATAAASETHDVEVALATILSLKSSNEKNSGGIMRTVEISVESRSLSDLETGDSSEGRIGLPRGV